MSTLRTQLINHLRSVLYEHGVTIGRSVFTLRRRLPGVMAQLTEIQSPLVQPLQDLIEELNDLQTRIVADEHKLKALANDNDTCRRLMQVPGIGYLNAVSLVAAIGLDSELRNGRHMSAWLGLTPKMHGTGGRIHIGRITHRGNQHLRTLLIHGARAAMNAKYDDPIVIWAKGLAKRQGHNKAVVALANKLARIAWVIIHRRESYDVTHHRPNIHTTKYCHE